MNLSEIMTSIKMDLGLIGLNLPVTDDDIMNVLKLRTLKTFNVYFPRIMNLEFKLRELRCRKQSYAESVYELPDIFGEYRIVGMRKITPVYNTSSYNSCGAMSPYTGLNIYGDMLMGQLEADLMSVISPSFTFKFREPNLIHLYNCEHDMKINVEVALEHFNNLSSIPYSIHDSFYDLAILDVKKFLYGILKNYEEIQTAYGNINLRLDEWSNADSDRKELIGRWADLYHLEADQFVII